MHFVNKQDREEVVELIYSGVGFCIVIDQIQTLESKEQNPVGKILRHGKKDFKKLFKKIKSDNRAVKMKLLTESQKEQVIETFETDKIGILDYSEDYIENQKYLDRQDEIQKQTEAQRVRMMKELADDYMPNGISVQQ